MDNLTHSLFALTLARTGLRREGPDGSATTAVLLLASNAPDVDIVAAFSADAGSYLAAHRGSTHGLLGVCSVAIASATLVTLVRRLRADPMHAPAFLRLVLVATVGAACHVLMDLPTPYGTRLLSPFKETWYAFDWMPIIDVYLLLLLTAGLVAGTQWPRARTLTAAAALLLMAANYALHGAAHAAAIRQSGGTGPWRLESWEGDPPVTCGAGPCASVAAIPTFGSPFTWRIIRPVADGYEVHQLDTLTRERRWARRVRNDENRWTALARATRLGHIYYSFSRFPAATTRPSADGGATVWINEVRFPGIVRSPSDVRSTFRAVIELDASGRARAERMGR